MFLDCKMLATGQENRSYMQITYSHSRTVIPAPRNESNAGDSCQGRSRFYVDRNLFYRTFVKNGISSLAESVYCIIYVCNNYISVDATLA